MHHELGCGGAPQGASAGHPMLCCILTVSKGILRPAHPGFWNICGYTWSAPMGQVLTSLNSSPALSQRDSAPAAGRRGRLLTLRDSAAWSRCFSKGIERWGPFEAHCSPPSTLAPTLLTEHPQKGWLWPGENGGGRHRSPSQPRPFRRSHNRSCSRCSWSDRPPPLVSAPGLRNSEKNDMHQSQVQHG